MAKMSDYLEDELIKHLFRTGSFTKPTVMAISLCTADPTDSGTGASMSEVANSGAYARVDVPPLDANWRATVAQDGETNNVAAITFTTATGSWGTVTHVAICDSATHGAGNMLFYGALTASKTVANGETFEFAIGALTITLA